MADHIPAKPWKIHNTYPDDIVGADGELVASAYNPYDLHKAAYIVQCCNAYPQLVKALKHCIKGLDGCSQNSVYRQWRKEAMDALKQAGEL